MPESLALSLTNRLKSMKSDRQVWETHWQDIADFVLPDRQFLSSNERGSQNRNNIFDSTAPVANERLTNLLNGMLTNASLQWFSLGTFEGIEDEDPDARAWLDAVRHRILRYLNQPQYRFYVALGELYQDLIGFGTGVIFIKQKGEACLFQSVPLADCYIDENDEGAVDTLFREIKYTARQAVSAFGDDVPEEVSKAMAENRPQEKFTFVQCVYPREDRNPDRMDASNKPWASVILFDGRNADPAIIRQSGFDMFPFLVPRWTKAAGEIYGRSPAMKVLPDIRLVNAMSRTVLESAQKAADPALQVPDDGFLQPIRTHPGGLNYYRAGSGDLIQPLNTGARPDIGEEMIQRKQAKIDEAFYQDLFQLPELDRMTAFEVSQRRNDRLQQFSPVLSRIYTEMLDPLITHIFSKLAPELADTTPNAIAGKRLKIIYVSPLALSQKSSEGFNIQQYLQYLTPMAQADPGVFNNIDTDEYARMGMGIFNVPGRMFRTAEEVEERRQAEQEAASNQNEAATALDAARAAEAGTGALANISGAGMQ